MTRKRERKERRKGEQLEDSVGKRCRSGHEKGQVERVIRTELLEI